MTIKKYIRALPDCVADFVQDAKTTTTEETYLLVAEINDKRVLAGYFKNTPKSLHQATAAPTAETAVAPQASKSSRRKRKNNNNSSKNCVVTAAAPFQAIPAQPQPQNRQVAAPVTNAPLAKRAYTGPHPACPTYTMASSGSGVSDASDPRTFTSDDDMATDSGVYTSDYTSTDEDDFQPFALPDFGDDVPLADGPPGEDLPLVPIPAPLPFTAVPLEEQPLDAIPDDDTDLLIEGPPEGDQDGGAPMEGGVQPVDIPVVDPNVPMVELPDMEVQSDSSASDSFESIASHIPPLGFDYIPRMDADEETELEQPAEAPAHPDDPIPAMLVDYQPALVTSEPVLAIDPVTVSVTPVAAPPAVEIPDPMAIFDDLAPFATHMDPRYAHSSNGWIEEDDYPPYVVPVTPPPAPIAVPFDAPLFPPSTSDTHCTHTKGQEV
ncbi:uncharacterized protein LOC118487504 [Helianthus annuus]|uniref:uncharacterized protein LOC118487504 n=1 Tax=Helianthus annuus TaxID=4232 RepID=UPI0016533E30|nr:uncharacterized protein LOC118487504 [Helianthus annuus]